MRDIMRSFQTIEKLLLGQQLLLAPALIKSRTKIMYPKYSKDDVLSWHTQLNVCALAHFKPKENWKIIKYISYKRCIIMELL